ncbi:MAG: YggS family pyridoxal phosphate-dependent enzyme [Oscillospiraceae bacterium]|nr:YggS family pyridoxal phosphate-dependent enzyme [Oscillospiraceae bacterium]
MDIPILKNNIEAICEKIENAAIASGRKRDDIILCAASKTRTVEEISESAKLGIDMFGENHAQELEVNFDAGAYLGKPASFIGHLQTNKVKKVVSRAELIQSVDSIKLADAIDSAAEKHGIIQDILLEVNIGGEFSKSGVFPEELCTLLEHASQKDHLRICGLMTIPPICPEDEARGYFAKMRELFEKAQAHNGGNIDLKILSMGMSADYCAAILEGSTMVRIGSAIYGPRNYNK